MELYTYLPPHIKNDKSQNHLESCIYNLIPNFINLYLTENQNADFLKADVFYGLEFFFGGIIANQLGKVLNTKVIIDFKELISEMDNYSGIDAEIIENYERSCLVNSVFVPCVSQKIIDVYAKRYEITQDKFVLLENTRPFDNLTPDFSRDSKKDLVKFIVSAGSAQDDRGFKELIKIWEQLSPHNAILHIRSAHITQSQMSDMIEIAKHTYNKSLFFIPSVKEDDMTETLLEYDCGIIPYLPEANLNNRYCCPNKWGQYMNAGLAIASSNTEYITERIEKNNLGIIYDPKNVDESVEKFSDLINNRDQLNQKRKNAHSFCKEHYEWNKNAKVLLTRIKELEHLKIESENSKKRPYSFFKKIFIKVRNFFL